MTPALLLEPPEYVRLDPAVTNRLINDPNAGVGAAGAEERAEAGAEAALVD